MEEEKSTSPDDLSDRWRLTGNRWAVAPDRWRGVRKDPPTHFSLDAKDTNFEYIDQNIRKLPDRAAPSWPSHDDDEE